MDRFDDAMGAAREDLAEQQNWHQVEREEYASAKASARVVLGQAISRFMREARRLGIPTSPFTCRVQVTEKTLLGKERIVFRDIKARAWYIGEPSDESHAWFLLEDGRLYQHGGSLSPLGRVNPVSASDAFSDPHWQSEKRTQTRESLRTSLNSRYDGYVNEIIDIMAKRIAHVERYGA